METILRVISWAVVLGASLALAYAGFKPVFQEFGFPPVDESQVGGAMLANGEDTDELASIEGTEISCDAVGNSAEDCEPHSP